MATKVANRKAWVQRKGQEFANPSDRAKKVLLESFLRSLGEDVEIPRTLAEGAPEDVAPLAFRLWAQSPLSASGFPSAVEVFDAGDRLVYATDTELETNALMSLDKRSGRCERMREFEGSCIYACRFGGLYALSTAVEPSPVNASRDATLWISRDLQDWRCAWRAEKDVWSAHYFQFGSIVLPCGHGPEDTLWLGGQAVSGIDGHTLAARPRGEQTAP